MRKVIGIFMAMVMVFLFTGMAFGEGNPKGFNSFEIQGMVEEWVEENNLDGYSLTGTFENGILHTIGVLDGALFERETGEKFSPEKLAKSYYDPELTGMELNVVASTVKKIGEHEGYDVYILNLLTKDTPIGEYNGKDVYHFSIIFMVME